MRAGRSNQLRRKVDTQPSQQLHDVGAPAGRDRGRPECIFENQVPADDPGEDFAQRCIAIRVGRSRDRNQRSELGVAQTGKSATHAGQDEREHDGRPGILGRDGSGQYENAGANDSSDAERDQVHRPKCALQGPFTGILNLGPNHVERLLGE